MTFYHDLENSNLSRIFRITTFLLILLGPVISVKSQDIIYMNNGDEIICKVYEITPEFIKYKNFDELDGPLRSIYNKDVFKIKYESGKQEMFNNREVKEENTRQQQTETQTQSTQPKEIKSGPITTTTTQYRQPPPSTTLISLGYGTGYGGLGVNLGTSISSITTLHIGGGWFPISTVHEGANDIFMVSGGAKIFFEEATKRSRGYLDLQFGMLGGEYTEENLYQNGSLISQTKKQQVLYGPTILLGTEGFWGKGNIGGRIAGGGSYNLAEVEWTDIGFLWALDIGIVFKL